MYISVGFYGGVYSKRREFIIKDVVPSVMVKDGL